MLHEPFSLTKSFYWAGLDGIKKPTTNHWQPVRPAGDVVWPRKSAGRPARACELGSVWQSFGGPESTWLGRDHAAREGRSSSLAAGVSTVLLLFLFPGCTGSRKTLPAVVIAAPFLRDISGCCRLNFHWLTDVRVDP